MDKRKELLLIAIELKEGHIYKCTYNMMWQPSSTLLKKLKQLAAQFYCFRAKIKIKPFRGEIVKKQKKICFETMGESSLTLVL